MPIDPAQLLEVLDQDRVLLDPDRMAGYRWDRANDPDAGIPLAVVRAESTADVQAAVRFADEAVGHEDLLHQLAHLVADFEHGVVGPEDRGRRFHETSDGPFVERLIQRPLLRDRGGAA